MKILIVDDDDVLLSWLTQKLEPLGWEIEQCQDGDSGLRLYKTAGPFEYVLTDYRFFPGQTIKNGLYLIGAIRKIDPKQRMIVQTSEENLIVPNGVKLLHKPYLFQQLLRLLRLPVQTLLF
jgi:ActR/RegA family two-component response regulator